MLQETVRKNIYDNFVVFSYYLLKQCWAILTQVSVEACNWMSENFVAFSYNLLKQCWTIPAQVSVEAWNWMSENFIVFSYNLLKQCWTMPAQVSVEAQTCKSTPSHVYWSTRREQILTWENTIKSSCANVFFRVNMLYARQGYRRIMDVYFPPLILESTFSCH